MVENSKMKNLIKGTTEELAEALHSIDVGSRTNMQRLFKKGGEELTTLFAEDSRKLIIVQAAVKIGSEAIDKKIQKTKLTTISLSSETNDILLVARKLKQEKINTLQDILWDSDAEVDIEYDDNNNPRRVDVTPVKKRTKVIYTEVPNKALKTQLLKRLRREEQNGNRGLTQEDLEEAKANMDYDAELRSSTIEHSKIDDARLNDILKNVFRLMSRYLLLEASLNALPTSYDDYTDVHAGVWADDNSDTLDGIRQQMLSNMTSRELIKESQLLPFARKITKEIDRMKWLCSIYFGQKEVDRKISDANRQIAQKMDKILYTNGTNLPQIAAADPRVIKKEWSIFQFYVSALESKARALDSEKDPGDSPKKESRRSHIRMIKAKEKEKEKEEPELNKDMDDKEIVRLVRKNLASSRHGKLFQQIDREKKESTTEKFFTNKQKDEKSGSESESEHDSEESDNEKMKKKKKKKIQTKRKKNSKKDEESAEEESEEDKSKKDNDSSKKVKPADKTIKMLEEKVTELTNKMQKKPKSETPCRFYTRGQCQQGTKCDFLHDARKAPEKRNTSNKDRESERSKHRDKNDKDDRKRKRSRSRSDERKRKRRSRSRSRSRSNEKKQRRRSPSKEFKRKIHPEIKRGSLCVNLMDSGKCEDRACQGPHGKYNKGGAKICNFESKAHAPCPYQANEGCLNLHTIAKDLHAAADN